MRRCGMSTSRRTPSPALVSIEPTVPLSTILRRYRASPDWRRLKPATQLNYERGLRHFTAADLAAPVTALTARRMRAIRNALAETPGTANQALAAVSAFLHWTMRQDEWDLDWNVCQAVDKMPLGHWKRWPETAIATFEAAMPDMPADVRLGVSLLLYTGQRRTDVLGMAWADLDDTAYRGLGAVRVLQSKTGGGDERNTLAVPLHPTLRRLLDAERGAAIGATIVADRRGFPYWREGAHRALQAPWYERVKLWQRKTLGQVYPLHGLRASAATRLAEAGCTPHEIMAVTGHRNLASVERYTRDTNRRTNAGAAMQKLLELDL